MMFRRTLILIMTSAGLGFAPGLAPVAAAFAQQTAVVPARTIYPGEKIDGGMVNVVEVTNPNLAGGYASVVEEVSGFVSTRTLLPGRTIPVAALREAWTVERGKSVEMVFAGNGLVITAPGMSLENATAGALVKVRNMDSGVIVSGVVRSDGSVQVLTK